MMTVDFLVRNLDNKAMQLFVASDFSAALVTQIATYPTGQRYFVLVSMGANNFEHIEPLLEEVEKQAKALGCLGLEIYGRDGWTRKLPSYRRVTTILRKTFEIPTPLVQNEEAVNEFAT